MRCQPSRPNPANQLLPIRSSRASLVSVRRMHAYCTASKLTLCLFARTHHQTKKQKTAKLKRDKDRREAAAAKKRKREEEEREKLLAYAGTKRSTRSPTNSSFDIDIPKTLRDQLVRPAPSCSPLCPRLHAQSTHILVSLSLPRTSRLRSCTPAAASLPAVQSALTLTPSHSLPLTHTHTISLSHTHTLRYSSKV